MEHLYRSLLIGDPLAGKLQRVGSVRRVAMLLVPLPDLMIEDNEMSPLVDVVEYPPVVGHQILPDQISPDIHQDGVVSRQVSLTKGLSIKQRVRDTELLKRHLQRIIIATDDSHPDPCSHHHRKGTDPVSVRNDPLFRGIELSPHRIFSRGERGRRDDPKLLGSLLPVIGEAVGGGGRLCT
ncbi:MAG: hypothetical protein D6736_05540, partial [Nitrospinota bacterium]